MKHCRNKEKQLAYFLAEVFGEEEKILVRFCANDFGS